MLFVMGVTVCAVSYYDYMLFVMGEWVSEYGALVESYLQQKAEVL